MLRSILLASLLARASTQSAEESPWDGSVTCSPTAATPTGAAITSVVQTSATSATVTYASYAPTMIWLTNEDGTIIEWAL